jgi:hypothetical protein
VLVAIALLAGPVTASAETIRVGLPTKTYWPTTVAETAVRERLFEKEGIGAELTSTAAARKPSRAWRPAPPISSSIRPRWCRRE